MDGQTVEGKVEILQFLRQFAGTARYAATDSAIYTAGDVALLGHFSRRSSHSGDALFSGGNAVQFASLR